LGLIKGGGGTACPVVERRDDKPSVLPDVCPERNLNPDVSVGWAGLPPTRSNNAGIAREHPSASLTVGCAPVRTVTNVSLR
jgi:hypothetical protein